MDSRQTSAFSSQPSVNSDQQSKVKGQDSDKSLEAGAKVIKIVILREQSDRRI
jgi:hypothetical protein